MAEESFVERRVEIFSAGCQTCKTTIEQLREQIDPRHEIVIPGLLTCPRFPQVRGTSLVRDMGKSLRGGSRGLSPHLARDLARWRRCRTTSPHRFYGPCQESWIHDMHNNTAAVERSEAFGIRTVPAIVVDGALLACCKNTGPTLTELHAAGLSKPGRLTLLES